MKKIIVVSILTLLSFNSFANDNAKRLTEQILKGDISIFRNEGNSNIRHAIPTVNALQLISEYNNNQYKYEKTYNNQIVNIKTSASGLKTDLSGEPFVVANGKNQFEYVLLELKNKDDAKEITEGNKLDLICVGTKDNLRFPILKNCVKSDDYFQKYFEVTMSKINKLEKDDKPSSPIETFYLALWKFDIQKPNTLDKYKTFSELMQNKSDFDEVTALVKANITEENRTTTMPTP